MPVANVTCLAFPVPHDQYVGDVCRAPSARGELNDVQALFARINAEQLVDNVKAKVPDDPHLQRRLMEEIFAKAAPEIFAWVAFACTIGMLGPELSTRAQHVPQEVMQEVVDRLQACLPDSTELLPARLQVEQCMVAMDKEGRISTAPAPNLPTAWEARYGQAFADGRTELFIKFTGRVTACVVYHHQQLQATRFQTTLASLEPEWFRVILPQGPPAVSLQLCNSDWYSLEAAVNDADQACRSGVHACALQQLHFITTALSSPRSVVRTSHCPYSEVLLQSEHSDCFSPTLRLRRELSFLITRGHYMLAACLYHVKTQRPPLHLARMLLIAGGLVNTHLGSSIISICIWQKCES